MLRIFRAELYRLKKSKFFYIVCLIMIAYTLNMTAFSDYSKPKMEDGLFIAVPFTGLLVGIFASQFFGEELYGGAIRNKLVSGCKRGSFLAAELLIFFIMASSVFDIAFLTALISGAAKGYKFVFSLPVILSHYFTCLCSIFLISSLTLLVCLCVHKEVYSLIICFALFLVLSSMGNSSYRSLLQPEYREPYPIETEQGITEPVENPLYISGTKRELYKLFVLTDPYGQTSYEYDGIFERTFSNGKTDSPKVFSCPYVVIPCFAAAESALLIFAGMTVFKKRDIK